MCRRYQASSAATSTLLSSSQPPASERTDAKVAVIPVRCSTAFPDNKMLVAYLQQPASTTYRYCHATQWSLSILSWVRIRLLCWSWVGRMGGWTNCFSPSLFIVYRTRRPSSSKAKCGGAIRRCFVYNLMSFNIQELTATALDASSCIGRTLNVLLPGRLHANSPAACMLTHCMMQ